MELKKGMYVRYTRGAINGYVPPRIAKIINKNNDLLKLDNNNEILESDIIGKPSFDLIDLIEVGDYVNGERVYYAYCSSEGSTGLFIEEAGIRVWLEKDSQIKDIVTNEQFNSMKYVVEKK